MSTHKILDYARKLCKDITVKNGKPIGVGYKTCVSIYGIDLEHENGDEVLFKARKYQEEEDLASDGKSVILTRSGIPVENPKALHVALSKTKKDEKTTKIIWGIGIAIITSIYAIFK